MKSKIIHLLSLVVIIAFLMPSLANAQAKSNFAGTWTLNAEKSTLPQGGPGGAGGGGGGGRMGGGSFTVTQDANTLTQPREGQNGPTSTKYTLDGKETVNSTGRGDSKSTATWSADGKTLTIVTKRSFNGNEMTTTETWSLVDAKTLSISSTRPGRDGGSTTTKLVYDKK
jgi:hypothetical protein